MGLILLVKGRHLDNPKEQHCLWIHFQFFPGVPSLGSSAGKRSQAGLEEAGGDTRAFGNWSWLLAWKEGEAGTCRCQLSALSLPGATRLLWFP